MTCTPLTHTLLTYTQLLTYNPPPPKPCCDSQVLTVVWGEGWTITPQTPDLCMPPTQHLTYTPIQLLTCVSPTLLLTCNPCNSQSLSTPTPQLLTCATSAPPPQHPPPPTPTTTDLSLKVSSSFLSVLATDQMKLLGLKLLMILMWAMEW